MGFKSNYKELANTQKNASGTPAYTLFVNRGLGRVLASYLVTQNASPNTITLVSFAMTISAFLSVFWVENVVFLHSLIIVILLILAFGLDSADGQMARLLKIQSAKGEWLDHTLDAIKIPMGHGVAMFIIMKHNDVNSKWLIFYLAVICLHGSLLLGGLLYGKLIAKKEIQAQPHINSSILVRSILTLPLDYGTFILFFLLSFSPPNFFMIYTVWGAVFLPYGILALIKLFRAFKS